MFRYYTCIHTPVFPSQLSGYSSLSGALSLSPSQFTHPCHHRVPQPVAKTTGRPIYQPIMFDYIGYFQQGVLLADFNARSVNALVQMVVGGNDLPLANTCVKEMNLYIMVRMSCNTESICLTNHWFSGRVTSIWIGHTVLLRVPQWLAFSSVPVLLCTFGNSSKLVILPQWNQSQWHCFQKAMSSAATCTRWKIGNGGVQYEKIILVGLYNIGSDVWQADIAVDLWACIGNLSSQLLIWYRIVISLRFTHVQLSMALDCIPNIPRNTSMEQ